MRHRKVGRILGRVRSQRKALMRTQLGSLIYYERITTTEAKAKELKPAIDKVITKAKKALLSKESSSLVLVRKLEAMIPKIALVKLSGNFMKRFDSRSSGYTRIVKLPPRRSDNARMAVIEFV